MSCKSDAVVSTQDARLGPHEATGAHGDAGPSWPPSVAAGLLLLARTLCKSFDLPQPDVDAILRATGASRTRAYVHRRAISDWIEQCHREPGRPRKPQQQHCVADTEINVVLSRSMQYLMRHPGAITGTSRRRRYSAGFRQVIVELCAPRRTHLPAIAAALDIPLGTIRRWLDCGKPHSCPSASSGCEAATGDDSSVASESLLNTPDASEIPATHKRIVCEWLNWHGPFTHFCRHLQSNCRIGLGRTATARILAKYGARASRRRSRVTASCVWRNSFERFFPGAQWVGDGTRITVWLDEDPFVFNLELMVDADTSALVGMSVRDQEDSQAVTQAFRDGVATIGARPLAVLLDNHPSNTSRDVAEAVGDSILMYATPGRPQNKAHVEGAFGLFAQTAPELRLSLGVSDRRQLAKQVLELVATTWARTLNHRPRQRNGYSSRVQVYRNVEKDSKSVDAARLALRRRANRRQSRVQIDDHPLCRIVRTELVVMGLVEPGDWLGLTRRVLCFPNDVIVDGMAIYAGKWEAGTIPRNAGARYLLGIMSKLRNTREGICIASRLLDLRCLTNTPWYAALTERHSYIQRTCPVPRMRLQGVLDSAMAARSNYEVAFWLDAAVEYILKGGSSTRRLGAHEIASYQYCARYILSASGWRHHERLTLIRELAARLVPIACSPQ